MGKKEERQLNSSKGGEKTQGRKEGKRRIDLWLHTSFHINDGIARERLIPSSHLLEDQIFRKPKSPYFTIKLLIT